MEDMADLNLIDALEYADRAADYDAEAFGNITSDEEF